VDPNQQLLAATRSQDLAGVKAALKAEADPNHNNREALQIAAGIPSTKILEEILYSGGTSREAQVDAACARKHWKAVRILLDWGADSKNLAYPSWKAIAENSRKIDATRPAYQRTFLKKIEEGDVEGIKKLLATSGVEINGRESTHMDPVRTAINCGQAAVLDVLLAHGARTENVNPTGYTPLTEAAMLKKPEICKVLLAHGAKVDGNKNEGGCTPLHLAAHNRDKETVELLILAGADTIVLDHHNKSPSDYGHEVVKAACALRKKRALRKKLRGQETTLEI